MCCCGSSSCSCGSWGSNSCGCGNSGVSTLPVYPDRPVWPGSSVSSASAASYPIYVSIPAFLWEDSGNNSGCGCGRG